MAEIKKVAQLGDSLVEQGVITPEQLKEALAEQRRTGRLLGRVLVENNYVTEEQISRTLAAQHGFPFVDVRRTAWRLEPTPGGLRRR